MIQAHLELEGDTVRAKIGVKLGIDVHAGGFPGGVLHHEEEFGHDLDHVASLEDEVALALHCFGGKAPWDVRLRSQLTGWRALQQKYQESQSKIRNTNNKQLKYN